MRNLTKATISKSLVETKKIALAFIKKIKASKNGATVIALSGNLGSGKTAFAKEVASYFGINKKEVTSPTFVIEKIYRLNSRKKRSNFSHLIHIDAYRLEKSKELLDLGWNKIIKDVGNLILIEWPERVPDIIPRETFKLRFEFVNEKTRKIYLP